MKIAVKKDNTTNKDTNEAEPSSNLFIKLKNRFRKLSTSSKVQLVAASVLTLAVLIAFPTVAWFANQKEMSVSTKINSPATLEIKSGGPKNNEQDIINFELSNIDTEDKSYKSYTDGNTKYYYKDYVFCVKGKAISSYDLQLAHTTNIPFKYDIYQAVQDSTLTETDTRTIVYESKDKNTRQFYRLAHVKTINGEVQKDNENNIIYEDYTTPLDGAYVNKDSTERILANETLTNRSYDNNDSYQAYANPLYWLKRNITVYSEEKTDVGFTHSYVLRVSWQMPDVTDSNFNRENINAVQNNKETDMIYITAAVS